MARPIAHHGTATDPWAATEFTRWAAHLGQLAREGVRREIADDLAAGRPVYYGGEADEAGKVFQLLPDGRRFEVRVSEDGSVEVVRQIA